MNVLTQPLFQFLLFLYTVTGNFGLAIIGFTLVIRSILVPFSVPALKSQKKMQQLKPKLDALKKKHGKDSKTLQQEQLKLYQQNNINPLGGCLPYLLQIVVLIALYSVLNNFLTTKEFNGVQIQTMFLGLDLAKPDHTYILPILAGITQLFLSVMILPGAEKHDLVPNQSKSKKVQKENKKEGQTLEMAETMQKQMVFMMPAITAFMAARFPAGLALYWVVTTVFSVVQQYIVTGPGGITDYWAKAKQLFAKKSA